MPDIERVQARLSNIESVAPILGALRTISLGSWQIALRRRGEVQHYGERLLALLPPVLAQMPSKKRRGYRKKAPPSPEAASRVVLVIGSERGLCGRYNTVIASFVARHVAQLQAQGAAVEVHVLGSRARRALTQQGIAVERGYELSATALPPFSLAESLTREHLAHRERVVDVAYSEYHNAVHSQPRVRRWLPPQLPPLQVAQSAEVIVETADPRSLYERILGQWAAVSLYGLLLEAAASEHAARFRLMESASQNADRLTEELLQELQSARRQAITQEMQELAAGAGLLG